MIYLYSNSVQHIASKNHPVSHFFQTDPTLTAPSPILVDEVTKQTFEQTILIERRVAMDDKAI